MALLKGGIPLRPYASTYKKAKKVEMREVKMMERRKGLGRVNDETTFWT